MKALVPVVLVVGLAIGWFGTAPAPRGEGVAGDTQGEQAQQSHLDVAARPRWYGGDMVLERQGDGHFYAGVRIDTRDFPMLVDTGASVIALTGEDARDAGLDWSPNALAPVARGANGVVMGVPVRLDEVAVGDFVVRDVEAVIVPEGLAISLLGQSFLSHVGSVAIAGDRMTLSD